MKKKKADKLNQNSEEGFARLSKIAKPTHELDNVSEQSDPSPRGDSLLQGDSILQPGVKMPVSHSAARVATGMDSCVSFVNFL